MQVAGVILAGGRSSRMGGADKAALTVAGKSLLDHVHMRIKGQCDPIALSCHRNGIRHDAELTILHDAQQDHLGPLAGILAGLEWAATLDIPHIVSVPVDTPFLPHNLVARLQSAGMAAIATSEVDGEMRAHPVVGLWPVAFRHDLRAILQRGERRVMNAAHAAGAVEVAFDSTDGDPFFNINTPEDVARADALLTP